MDKKVIRFRSVIFDLNNGIMEILDGSKGLYSFKDILKSDILNEKSKYHNKMPHFTALVPHGPLPMGILQNPYLYVGIKVVLQDGTILAIYISEKETMKNTNQYIADRKKAGEIQEIILKIIKENKKRL